MSPPSWKRVVDYTSARETAPVAPWKAGEGDRTLDIQLGKRKVPFRNRALRVSFGGHPMRLLHLLRVDA